MKHSRSGLLSVLLFAAIFVGCGADQKTSAPESGAPSLAISPTEVTVSAGGTVTFTATTTPSSLPDVVWSVQESGGGTVSGAGAYTAPLTLGTYHVQVRLRTDPSVVATATVTVVTLPFVSLSISPQAADLTVEATQRFRATVTGGFSTPVTWSIAEGTPAGGTITADGLYTASTNPGTYHVIATSTIDPGKSVGATVTVHAPPIVSVVVSPSAANMATGETRVFQASVDGSLNSGVTWRIRTACSSGPEDGGGSHSDSGHYTVYQAPAAEGVQYLTATSVADPTQTACATITVAAASITVNPSQATIRIGDALALTAGIEGTDHTAATWKIQEGSAGGTLSTTLTSDGASVVYVAPRLVGTYHILATSMADPTRVATATVTVIGTYASVAAGGYHTVASKPDGTLWAWGSNQYGQLGDGGNADRYSPTRIGKDRLWAAVAAGGWHTIALDRSGGLWSWGSNVSGQLGDGSYADRNLPTRVGASGDSWIRFSPGFQHSAAIKSDGTLWTWGANGSGQLGHGGNVAQSAPVQVAPGTTDWVAVSSGQNHTVGIRAISNIGGTVSRALWAWGSHADGQLGDRDSTADPATPAQIGTFTDWDVVVAGSDHNLGIRAERQIDGSVRRTLWAWGRNTRGQIGDGTTVSKSAPTQIGTDGDWSTVAAGNDQSFAIKLDGSRWAWGGNVHGELGDGTVVSRAVPTRVGATSTWLSVSGGFFHAAAIKGDGSLWIWGHNGAGQLGDGTVARSSVPVRAGTSTWVRVAAGGGHTVGIRNDGSLWSWGANGKGQLGNGTDGEQDLPTRVGTETGWSVVEAGREHTVALKNKTLWAWGDNSFGQLGNGESGAGAARHAPVQIGTATDWEAIAAGAYHTLGIRAEVNPNGTVNRTLWAWGADHSGQLGVGVTSSSVLTVPTQVGTAGDWLTVAAGAGHTVGIRAGSATDRTLWSWGDNISGQLGDGTFTNRDLPVPVGSDRDWSAVKAGNVHTFAIKTNGSLYAWGNNGSGQLGNGSGAPVSSTPTPLGFETNWLPPAGGEFHGMALKSDRTLWTWGANFSGQLGNGASVNRNDPTQIGTSTWGSIAGGFDHSVGVRSDGTLWAWGNNFSGQMGDGTAWRETPINIP